MALVEFVDPVVNKTIEYQVSDLLEPKWKVLSKKVIKQNDDRVFVVVGQEGSGKSTFAFQQAKYIDPTFNLDRICFTAEQFLDQIKTAGPGRVVVFDEAFRGFSSKSTQSKVNKLLVQAMMEVRRRNLIIFIVIPSLILLENYIAVHRSNVIFFIYKRAAKGNRYHGWKAYNRNKAAEIYHKAKKRYGIIPKVFTSIKGKFWARKFDVEGVQRSLPYETFDERAYDNKKGIAFGDKKEEDKVDDSLQALRDFKYRIGTLKAPNVKKLTRKLIAEHFDVTTRTLSAWKSLETPLKDGIRGGNR